MSEVVNQYMKTACFVMCPICDEDKCVGRFNCGEIKRYTEELKQRDSDHHTKQEAMT